MPEEKLKLLESNTAEIITGEELKELVASGKQIKVYAGYEPSGKIHLGHALSVNKLIDFQKTGAEVIVLLADFHAYLNRKGTLEEIRKTADYNRKCFTALGLDEKKTRFILGSEIQLSGEYFINLQKLALETTLLRAKRSMDVVGRAEENPSVARVIYPLMQVIDMAALDVDVAIGGLDQRKIHMLGRDNLAKLGFKAPVCIHLPIIHGLDGSEKMSSSLGNFVSIDDSDEEIKRKIKQAYCPEGVIEGNPILELYHYFIFPKVGEDKVEIKRPEKFGGNLCYSAYKEMEKDFAEKKVHPADLKSNLAEQITANLSEVRKRL